MLVVGKSGVGKCLSKLSCVLLDNGGYLSVSELGARRNKGKVLSVNDRLKLHPQKIAGLSKRHLRPDERMLRVTTRTGRMVELTSDHLLLAFDGWKRAEDLKMGERIAVTQFSRSSGRARCPNAG